MRAQRHGPFHDERTVNRLERTIAKEDVVDRSWRRSIYDTTGFSHSRLQRLVWTMDLLEREEKRRYAEVEVERILVAFGKPRSTVVVFVGPAFEYEDENGFDGIDDLLETNLAPGLGIWVWEGKPKPSFGASEWGEEFEGYNYKGAWREPTDEELKAAMGGENPWTKPCPACFIPDRDPDDYQCQVCGDVGTVDLSLGMMVPPCPSPCECQRPCTVCEGRRRVPK